jgi:hypothetical protein
MPNEVPCWRVVFDIFCLGPRRRDVQASRLIAVISLPAALMRAMASAVFFDRGRHVMGVGMNDGVGIAHDRDKCDRRCEVLH